MIRKPIVLSNMLHIKKVSATLQLPCPSILRGGVVKNMSDSDLLDMHYFLTEDDDLEDGEFEEGFYIDLL